MTENEREHKDAIMDLIESFLKAQDAVKDCIKSILNSQISTPRQLAEVYYLYWRYEKGYSIGYEHGYQEGGMSVKKYREEIERQYKSLTNFPA